MRCRRHRDIGSEAPEPRRKRRIVAISPRRSDVFEHHDIDVHNVLEVRCERDVLAEQLCEPRGHWPQRQRRLAIARPAQVGDEQYARAALAQRGNRRQRKTQAGVVGNLAVGAQRHVELGANEDASSGEVAEILESSQAPAQVRQILVAAHASSTNHGVRTAQREYAVASTTRRANPTTSSRMRRVRDDSHVAYLPPRWQESY